MEKENCIKTGKTIDETKLSNYEHEFDIKCTAFPKQEVAYGLVCDKVIQDKQTGKTGVGKVTSVGIANPFESHSTSSQSNTETITERTIVAGEDFILDGMCKNGIEGVLPEYILREIKVNKDFRVFNAFLSKFNEQAADLDLPEIMLEKRDFNDIWSAVNTELIEKNTSSGGSAKNVEVEPLFIMILRNTLRMI